MDIKHDDIAQVLMIDDCLKVLEHTFRDYAEGKGLNRPRAHNYAPIEESPQTWYIFKTMDAVAARHALILFNEESLTPDNRTQRFHCYPEPIQGYALVYGPEGTGRGKVWS